jgi:rhamnulokinase
MTPRVFAAVDLGASGGRVVAGLVDGESLSVEAVHRFPNGAREVDGRLRWPVSRLYDEVLTGLGALAERYPQVESIGIDTWGVDYGLLDAEGKLLAEPTSYRDDRTAKVVDEVHALVPPDELFAHNGLQFLPFTTLYQLASERRGPLWPQASALAMLPDLLAYWLTGELRTERTNASTTGLLDVRSGEWSLELVSRLGLRGELLTPLVSAGTVLGPVRAELRERLNLPAGVVVTTVGSHDTASAVAGVPATTDRFAYVSSGTWSLVGVELAAGPVLTEGARRENFTNELGVDRRIRFLRNTGGLWLLQESLRTWAERGEEHDLDRLLGEAASLPVGGALIDVDDASFVAPGPMPERIAAGAVAAGFPAPVGPAQTVRCVVDSLARAYADGVRRGAELSDGVVDVVHLVGGGSQNALLGQATADAAGRPVLAGPAEATAIGNLLVQARAHGAIADSLDGARALVAAGGALRRYEPA